MKTMNFLAMAIAFGGIAACSRSQSGQSSAANETTVETAGQVYSGTGTVRSISGDRVAIAHGPIAGIGWPAMTMTFTAPPGMADRVRPGIQVDFSFRRDGSTYVLTSIKPR